MSSALAGHVGVMLQSHGFIAAGNNTAGCIKEAQRNLDITVLTWFKEKMGLRNYLAEIIDVDVARGAKEALKISALTCVLVCIYYLITSWLHLYAIMDVALTGFLAFLAVIISASLFHGKIARIVFSYTIYILIKSSISIYRNPKFFGVLKKNGEYVIDNHQITSYGIIHYFLTSATQACFIVLSFLILYFIQTLKAKRSAL